MRIGLHQLRKSGATNGQVPVWDETAQEWRPADQTGGGGGAPSAAFVDGGDAFTDTTAPYFIVDFGRSV